MKHLIIAIIIFMSSSFTTKDDQLLTIYLDIKNALIKGDAATAATKAAEFVKASTQDKLSADAAAIAKTTDLGQQRELFKTFSTDMYAFAKTAKLSEDPLYYQYCPMKKSYWLSKEKTISNPYYGKQMLTCGKVNETL